VISFFGTLLLPFEITHGGFKDGNRILEISQATVAVIAQQAADVSCPMIVVNCQATDLPTTTSVSLASTANSTFAILLLKKDFILFSSAALSPCLAFSVFLHETGTAEVLAVRERWKLFRRLFLPTPLAHREAILDTFVLHLMQSAPN
jgi:hypothetical protein